jgi:PAS domain S-box-containing protein
MDIRTLLACLAAVNVFLAVVMVFYWRTQRVYPGFGLWTACNAILAAVYLLLSLRGVIPPFVSIVIANDLILVAAVMRLEGIRRYFGAARFSYPVLLVPAAGFVLLSYFTLVRDDQYARTAILNGSLGLTLWVIAWQALAQARGRDRLAYGAVGALFAAYGGLLVGRAFYWVVNPQGSTLMEPNFVNVASYLAFMLLDIGVTLAFLDLNHLRTARDLEAAQQAAESSRSQVTEILAFLPDATCAVDADLTVVAWNRAAVVLTGVPSEKVLGMPYREAVAPIIGDREPSLVELAMDADLDLPAGDRDVRRDGATVTEEVGAVTIAGHSVSLWKTAMQLRDGSGATGGAVESIRDITSRILAEADVREAKARFELIFNASPDAVVITRLSDGVVVDVNATFLAMTGYAREEAIGPSSLDLKLWKDPSDRGHVVATVLREGRCQDFETVFVCKDGSEIIGSMSARGIEVHGEPHIISITRDITDRKHTEQARLELDRHLQQAQKLESLGVLTGGLAHDFNNILMVILGNVDLALADLEPSAAARESLLEIDRAAHQAAGLCRQMLAYSGRGEFVTELIDLRRLAEDMVSLLRSGISKRVVLDMRMEPDLPPVLGDPSQLSQVIMNLALNASEAIEDRDGTITMSTASVDYAREELDLAFAEPGLDPGRYVVLTVSDTGMGMDAATLDRLFEPFFTTKFAGRGLGLSAVRGIVRGHRGGLRVRSEPGMGSTFTVAFPIAADTAAAADAFDRAIDTWRGEGTILLVDDDPAIRALGSRMMGSLGFEVVTAVDGLDALEVYQRRGDRISLVILDLTMPQMGGEETLRELRRLDPGVQVLLSSGYTESDVASRLGATGAQGFVSKPYTLTELRHRIRAVLRPEGDPPRS